MQLRKIVKTRGHFPNDVAAIKLLWLALRNVLAKSVRAAFDWKSAMNQFATVCRHNQCEAGPANGRPRGCALARCGIGTRPPRFEPTAGPWPSRRCLV